MVRDLLQGKGKVSDKSGYKGRLVSHQGGLLLGVIFTVLTLELFFYRHVETPAKLVENTSFTQARLMLHAAHNVVWKRKGKCFRESGHEGRLLSHQ